MQRHVRGAMPDALAAAVTLAYVLVIGALFVYGVNFFYLAALAWRHQREREDAPPLCTLPRVTVQLPIYNELYVAERLIDAAAQLDYPGELFEIQVLDDSTDETRELVQAAVERWRGRGVPIVHTWRSRRAGFKAGALAHGTTLARGEFIAIFDADFVPGRDFLRRTLPHFHDPRVAFVQTRWEHLNRRDSALTALQALAIDAHFAVEQFARAHGGYWFNFNGTAGIWRRAALDDAGGWKADTLTEDLDLSYRAFLRGWRAVYLRGTATPAELPASIGAYRRQQHRWARGSLECALTLLPRVWRAPVALRRKLQASLHLTGYGVHLLLLATSLLYPLVVLLAAQYRAPGALLGFAVICNLSAFAPLLSFSLAQQQLGRRWWRWLPLILCVNAFGAGMMLNTARAALQIALRRSNAFERTPKFGNATRTGEWMRRRYQVRLDPLVFAETFAAFWNLGTVALALYAGNWLIAFYAALFAAGLLFVAGLSVAQACAVRRAQAAVPGERATQPASRKPDPTVL